MGYGLIRIHGFSMYPDEFGYWASAANNIGYDWSQVASLGSYYAFGYSLILTPILWIFKGGVIAYRVAIVINALLQCISLILLKGIFKRIYPKMPKIDAIYCIGIAIFYPVWSYYVQMTLTEALLSFLFILTVFLMVRFLEKPSFLRAVIWFIPVLYMITVHMRTVGVVGVAFLTFMLWAWSNLRTRKYILIAFISVIVVGVGFITVKGIVQSTVYANVDKSVLAINDFTSILVRIKAVLNKDGILNLIQGIIGKVWYLGLSSFGTFYIAMGYMFKQTVLLFKRLFKNKNIQTKQYVCFFILFSMIAQILITAVYMLDPYKLDNICYGRYNEYILPIIMAIGIRQLMRSEHPFRYAFITILVSIPMCAIVIRYSLSVGTNNIHEYFVAGISYLWNVANFDIVNGYIQSELMGSALILFMVIAIYFSDKRGHYTQLLNAVIVIEIVLAIVLSVKSTYISGDVDRVDSRVSRAILQDENTEAHIYYLNESKDRSFVDLIQFNLRDRTVNVSYPDQIVDQVNIGDYVILDMDSTFDENIKDKYHLEEETYWFKLYKKQKE